MSSITSYMNRHGFGDYSHASQETREEMESTALEYAAQEQTRPSIFRAIGLKDARDRYEDDRATAADLMGLVQAGEITAEDAASYRTRHGWTPRKYQREA